MSVSLSGILSFKKTRTRRLYSVALGQRKGQWTNVKTDPRAQSLHLSVSSHLNKDVL